MDFPSPYFLQTQDWADFWLKANPKDHEVHLIRCQIDINEKPVELVAFIYQYPWYFGQNFLYIPKGPFLETPAGTYPSQTQVEELLEVFFQQITALSKKLNSTFIKLDFDDNICQQLNLRDNEQLVNYLKKKFQHKFRFYTKELQYLQTTVLAVGNLYSPSTNQGFLGQESLREFYQKNQDFWQQVNQTTRRYTKKSLDLNWKVSAEKSPDNFKNFWKIIRETSAKQGFFTHQQSYYFELFKQNFSRILVLYDEQGQPHAAWLGIILNRTLTYLYGGNTNVSRKKHGQYLLHLAALYLCSVEKVTLYDFGGYDQDKGYGQFKEGYKGELRSFLGPTDLILKSWSYSIMQGSISWVKGVKAGWHDLLKKRGALADLLFKFAIGLILISSLPLWWFTLTAYLPRSKTEQNAKVEVAMVLGASVDFIELKPSQVLQNRLDAAADLYEEGKIKTVLVSGDNRLPNYNEPFVMKKYLTEERGLPLSSIVEDFGGRRTLDSCWRAKNVFKAERIYLVTQAFHLPRANFNCENVGLETVLIRAENSGLNTTFWGIFREIPASWLALEEAMSGYEPPVLSDGTETNVEEVEEGPREVENEESIEEIEIVESTDEE